MLRNKLYSQILNVRNYIVDLKSIKFYNKASSLAISSYETFFSFLLDNFDQLEEFHYHEMYLELYNNVIPDLRYIERSSTNNIPWSFISNLDKILKEELSDEYYLLYRPQWKFNYSVINTDLINSFKKFLNRFFGHKEAEIDKIFNSYKIYIFSFPYLEKSNVLLNSIIGHEIGHFYHNNWISTKEAVRIKTIQKNELAKYYHKSFRSGIFPVYNKIIEGEKLIQGMCREIFSDIYGYFIFGPSMIFSLFYISYLETQPIPPSSSTNYYPLLKYRIRILYDYLLKTDENINKYNNSDFANNLHNYLDEIEKYLENKDDLEILKKNRKELELFEHYLPEIINYFKLNIKYKKFNPKFLVELYNKLKKHIPINEIRNQPTDIASIIYVGWIYHYNIDTTLSYNDYAFENKVLMKLLMKSLFSTFVHQEYLDTKNK
jgi:hypothetical protein